MKLICFCFLFLQLGNLSAKEIELTRVRDLYYQSVESKDASNSLTTLLSSVNDKSLPVLIGYKGAAQMIEAKYAFNPITKLSKFRKGKSNIEMAIRKDPSHVEIRFLRFSIQTNLPSFLGYDKEIMVDKKMLLNAVPVITDAKLKRNVVNYLLTSKYCTTEELKKLKNWQKA